MGTNSALQKNRLRIFIEGEDTYYQLRALKRGLPKVVVKGVPTVVRAIININAKDDGKKELLVEGYGLRNAMITEGMIGTRTTSNHVMEVQKVLGMEAARSCIISEYVTSCRSRKRCTDHLFNAALYAKRDVIEGVSECIIMGNPAQNCGTSMPAILLPKPAFPRKRSLLFEGSFTKWAGPKNVAAKEAGKRSV